MGQYLRVLRVVVAVGVALGGTAAFAQASPPDGVSTVLQQMASHAAVIFNGQVIAVTRNDAAGFVDVRFHIDEAVRGCPKSGSYVLREWAGLWSGKPERYRAGQRRLMLLTARGDSGMSSPLGGMDGAIPLVATGAEPLVTENGAVPADKGEGVAPFAVDLRWIQARALRAEVPGSGKVKAEIAYGGPAMPSRNGDWVGAVSPLTPDGGGAAAIQAVNLTVVLALLRNANVVSDARY